MTTAARPVDAAYGHRQNSSSRTRAAGREGGPTMRTRRETAPPITAATADDGPRPEERTVRGTW
ncbi:hypothetical protein GCM10010433_63920 [Streptomyces pulveraceus]